MRPNRDEYLMWMAVIARTRATCRRPGLDDGVGCVIASTSGHVLSTGYNGSPAGVPHCDDIGHQHVEGRCVRTIHAEINAGAQAASRGVAINGAVAYVTSHPCFDCAKFLVAAGVFKVVYLEPYRENVDVVTRSLVPNLMFVLFDGRRPWLNQPAVRRVERRGRLIVIEGIDGSGKSTIARELVRALPWNGLGPDAPLLACEPGGTEFGDRIRSAMVDLDERPSPLALTHAFIAARAQLFATSVHQALVCGGVVISDRSFISSMVYQGRDPNDMMEIMSANMPVVNHYQAWPDRIILLDLPAEMAMSRSKGVDDPGGYDTDSVAKHEARRLNYLFATRIVGELMGCGVTVIDASRAFGVVMDDVLAAAMSRD